MTIPLRPTLDQRIVIRPNGTPNKRTDILNPQYQFQTTPAGFRVDEFASPQPCPTALLEHMMNEEGIGASAYVLCRGRDKEAFSVRRRSRRSLSRRPPDAEAIVSLASSPRSLIDKIRTEPTLQRQLAGRTVEVVNAIAERAGNLSTPFNVTTRTRGKSILQFNESVDLNLLESEYSSAKVARKVCDQASSSEEEDSTGLGLRGVGHRNDSEFDPFVDIPPKDLSTSVANWMRASPDLNDENSQPNKVPSPLIEFPEENQSPKDVTPVQASPVQRVSPVQQVSPVQRVSPVQKTPPRTPPGRLRSEASRKPETPSFMRPRQPSSRTTRMRSQPVAKAVCKPRPSVPKARLTPSDGPRSLGARREPPKSIGPPKPLEVPKPKEPSISRPSVVTSAPPRRPPAPRITPSARTSMARPSVTPSNVVPSNRPSVVPSSVVPSNRPSVVPSSRPSVMPNRPSVAANRSSSNGVNPSVLLKRLAQFSRDSRGATPVRGSESPLGESPFRWWKCTAENNLPRRKSLASLRHMHEENLFNR